MASNIPNPSCSVDDPEVPNFVQNVLRECDALEKDGSDVDNCKSDQYSESEHESESEQEAEPHEVEPHEAEPHEAEPREAEPLLAEIQDSDEGNLQNEYKNCFFGKNRFKWSRIEKSRKTRVSADNIIKMKLPGLRISSDRLAGESSFLCVWNLLFSEEITSEIIMRTNEKLDSMRQKYSRESRPELRELDKTEFQAFLGLLLYSGIFKSNHEDLASMFATDGTGRDIFRTASSLKRVMNLLTALRFDDAKTRKDRKLQNPLAPISWVFEKFTENCQKAYNPGEYICIDEMLVGFRGRCMFKMYMPNKPNKYGLKVVILSDAKTNYFYNGYIYCGKNSDGLGLEAEFSRLSKPTQSVLRLAKPIFGSKRNITADNWFSSIELVTKLKEKGLTYVGTLRKNKKEIPLEFLPNKSRPQGSSKYGFNGNMTLLSYVPKKCKSVILISTIHHSVETDSDSGKPEIIEFYNSTKSGVDTLDKKCENYSVGRRTRRWPMAIFYALMNICGVNAFVLYNSLPNRKEVQRFVFLKSVARDLILPELKRRVYNDRLPVALRTLIKDVLGPDAPKEPEKVVENTGRLAKRKRCYICPSSIDRKTSSSCWRCKKPVCNSCASSVCKNCQDA